MRRGFVLLVVGTALAVPVAAAASSRDVNTVALVGSGRGWDPDSNSSSYLTGSGFTPVDDGALVIPGRIGDDAFDGGLLLGVDGTAFADSDGKGSFSAKTESFTVGPDPVGPTLKVSETERAAGPYLRVLVKLSNPTGSAYSGTITSATDVGSDSSESTQASSSGDKTFTPADRWVVSSATGADAIGDDPTVTLVFCGKGAKNKVTTVQAVPGQGNIVVDLNDVSVPANSSRYLLFYAEMNANPRTAKSSALKYNAKGLSSSLLKYIPTTTQKKILNWKLG